MHQGSDDARAGRRLLMYDVKCTCNAGLGNYHTVACWICTNKGVLNMVMRFASRPKYRIQLVSMAAETAIEYMYECALVQHLPSVYNKMCKAPQEALVKAHVLCWACVEFLWDR